MRKKPKKTQIANVLMALPQTGFLRLPQVLMFFPVSKSTFWEMIREGTAPSPVKLSRRCAAWRVADIRALIESKGGNENE
jgi:predicted DNA-binding transcriptional regulator AlpA